MIKIIAFLVWLAILTFKSDALRSANTAYDVEFNEDWDEDEAVSIFSKISMK